MQVSSPGRADFLNTHQDYKNLPVVPVGLNLRTRIMGSAIGGTKIRVESANLEEEGQTAFDEFDIRETEYKEKGWFGNYIRATISVLKRLGYSDKVKGANMIIESDVPIGAGLGSSGALEVAALGFFDAVFKLNLSKSSIAEYSYLAERQELGIPCGRLDQYASTYGGIMLLETHPPFKIEELPLKSFFLTVIDSGIRHSTVDIHTRRQRELDKGLGELLDLDLPKTTCAKLNAHYADVKWEKLRETELAPYLKTISQRSANRVRYTLRSQHSTNVALSVLRLQTINISEVTAFAGKSFVATTKHRPRRLQPLLLLGAIMNYQHGLLRDLYEVSLPKLEKLRDIALSNGALGVKLSGAGMGGSLLALAENKSEACRILKTVLAAGAANGWVCTVDEGVRVDSTPS